uniref:Uncharacterized protein n=1 Tax=viral metagenome TaxID=1070528 RepID=A0A6M3LP45_9ZZZZ
MANLIGYLQGNRSQVSRLGSKVIDSSLRTWDARIDTTLTDEGNYIVSVDHKYGRKRVVIAEGNLKEKLGA